MAEASTAKQMLFKDVEDYAKVCPSLKGPDKKRLQTPVPAPDPKHAQLTASNKAHLCHLLQPSVLLFKVVQRMELNFSYWRNAHTDRQRQTKAGDGGGGEGGKEGGSVVHSGTGRCTCTILESLRKVKAVGQGGIRAGGGGGGGSGAQKFVHQKWPDKIFPTANFVFSHNVHFGLGGRGLPPPPPPAVCGHSNTSLLMGA